MNAGNSQSISRWSTALHSIDVIFIRWINHAFDNEDTSPAKNIPTGSNHYEIINGVTGELIFYAVENSNRIRRFLFGLGTSFSIQLYDKSGELFLSIRQSTSFVSICCGRCPNKISVYPEAAGNPGKEIGTISQHSCFSDTYSVNLASSTENSLSIQPSPSNSSSWRIINWFCVRLQLTGLRAPWPTFQILKNENFLGEIRKEWEDRESGISAMVSGIQFSRDLDDNQKLMLFGGLFLIHFIYYDTRSLKITLTSFLWYLLVVALLLFGGYHTLGGDTMFRPKPLRFSETEKTVSSTIATVIEVTTTEANSTTGNML